LGAQCDLDKVRKVYKLGAGDAGKKGKKGSAVNGRIGLFNEIRDIESVILGTMALKGS